MLTMWLWVIGRVIAFLWLGVLFSSMAALWKRPDVEVLFWAGARPWWPWVAAARSIEWFRQRTGREVLDRIVDFRTERARQGDR